MILDFLPHGSPDCPLVRLSKFSPVEARQLHDALSSLADGTVESIAVHELPFVEAIGEVRLTCRRSQWDQSLVKGITDCHFECRFSPETWENVAGLIEPFTKGAAGFQWLAGGSGEIGLLVSVDGQW